MTQPSARKDVCHSIGKIVRDLEIAMAPEQFDAALESLRTRIFPLARSIHALSQAIDPPTFRSREQGFRYSEPNLLHFCLLRAARVVSALNACIDLACTGFTQEIAVLLRTNLEYCSQVEYMLASRAPDGKLTDKAKTFLEGFFADSERPRPADVRRPKLQQEHVHQVVGARLDKFANDDVTKNASEMMSNTYLIFSNYVHGRYPESMDMYGGRPGRFHLFGMRGTPKDAENLETLDTLIQSASTWLRSMIVELRLKPALVADPLIAEWLKG